MTVTESISIAALASNAALQERIDAVFAAHADSGISIALHVSGRDGFAGAGVSPTACVRPGCTTKLLTAALLRSLMRESRLPLDTPARALLDRRDARLQATLEGVSVRHLLEHSHGLDSSGIEQLRRRSDGYLDLDDFLGRLEHCERLAPPGEVCSYADAGAWLAAFILERACAKRFGELLAGRLPAPASMPCADYSSVCPATGGDFSTPIQTLLAFLAAEMQPGAAGLLGDLQPAQLESQVVPRSGWSCVDCGVFLAWAYYGNGWLGHNSIHPCAPLMVRVNPARSIALLVATRRINPTLVAARVFGRLLPELFHIRRPGVMSDTALSNTDLSAFTGCYANQSARFDVTTDAHHGICVTACERKPAASASRWGASGSFAVAHNSVLICRTPQPRLPRFLQFIGPQPGGYRYLWDGESVLPRLADL